ncbi:putative protein kinase RLK-Pelle-L-LEC family [Helianthus annuus]|nr:putative protein kinase RLK-Pelle-L-LEC family [Helianthus annuus]
MGDVRKLFPTFSVPVNNRNNGHTGLTREEEIGELEKQYMISKNSDHEKFKTEFLNEYFENLNISANEPDWNILILQAMSFKDFQDCKALLNMLEDEDYVIKYKYYLETTFNNMIEWFLKEKLEIHTRPLPAYASNNRKVELLDLYMALKREGGHRRITENNMWAMIAKDTGFEYEDGEYMRLIYAMYLDVLVYYYKFKTTQERAIGKEEEKIVDPRQSMSEGDTEIIKDAGQTETAGCSSSTGAIEREVKHYALFTNQAGALNGFQEQSEEIQDVAENHYASYGGSDWHGLKKLQQRKRFDFSRAKKAVNEANYSVIKHSLCILAYTIRSRIRKRHREEAAETINLTSINEDLEQGAGPKRFSYRDLALATNNFTDDLKLGEGGFGCVYRGFLTRERRLVAVKKISKGSKQGKKEYITEVKIISSLRHRNLVQLIGWCHDENQFLIVYEFMPNGSLDSHLFGNMPPLAWGLRYKISLGLASALLYLHEEWEQCVIHRDIKSSNVMLDSAFNAKLGDFGLARLMDHELGLQTRV